MIRKVQVWIHFCDPESQRWVLLLKTRADRGGFWQPVTGGVEENETFEQAALREAEEETHLAFVSPLQDLLFEYEFQGRWGQARERVYALEASFLKNAENAAPLQSSSGLPLAALSVKIDPTEHDEWQWVNPSEALNWLHFDSNRVGLKLLIESWSRS